MQNNILMPEIVKGLEAAGRAAIEQARRTKTKLVVWRDGDIAEITPDEAETMMKASEEKKGA